MCRRIWFHPNKITFHRGSCRVFILLFLSTICKNCSIGRTFIKHIDNRKKQRNTFVVNHTLWGPKGNSRLCGGKMDVYNLALHNHYNYNMNIITTKNSSKSFSSTWMQSPFQKANVEEKGKNIPSLCIPVSQPLFDSTCNLCQKKRIKKKEGEKRTYHEQS